MKEKLAVLWAFGFVVWLMYGLRKVVELFNEGTFTITPEPTRLALAAMGVSVFWGYVCTATLWPGSLLMWGVVKLMMYVDAQGGNEL